ncbi:hypothetical protein LINPERPRIM_LOCUS25563 [Linum perenne]
MHPPLRRNPTTGPAKRKRQPPAAGHQILSLRTTNPKGKGRKRSGEETAGAATSPTTTVATGRKKSYLLGGVKKIGKEIRMKGWIRRKEEESRRREEERRAGVFHVFFFWVLKFWALNGPSQ